MGWTWLQRLRLQQAPGYARRAFATSAIQLDELIYLPLPLFGRLLAECMAACPEEAASMLETTAASTGQKWAVAYAAPHWVAGMGGRIKSLAELERCAHRIDGAAAAVGLIHRRHAALGDLLNDFAAVAHSLASIQQTRTAAVAQRVLDRNLRDLDSLKVQAGITGHNELLPMAAHWQELIRGYEQRLDTDPHVLAGVYQAGSALEIGSPLFRGRRDVFERTDEVYADPNRAETLLLIAQQRMGKSSTLMQLPAQLPDAHVVVVDCQRILSGRGEEPFVAGLSRAIQRWERRRPGGVRQKALDIETLGQHPLSQLDQWLERYADAVGNKRVLLCLDEFDKLVQRVHDGDLSSDVLALLRSLSQSPEWMLLYSGQFELDNWIRPHAEYLKNVRRVRISYLDPADATELLERPVPNFALTWHPAATAEAIRLTGCQPYLLQMVGNAVVAQFNADAAANERVVHLQHVQVTDAVLDSGRNYFISLQNAFDHDTNRALCAIARTGTTDADTAILNRLVDHEYIAADGSGTWRFRVPLLSEWWRTRLEA